MTLYRLHWWLGEDFPEDRGRDGRSNFWQMRDLDCGGSLFEGVVEMLARFEFGAQVWVPISDDGTPRERIWTMVNVKVPSPSTSTV
jgi:hypothetical protein